MWSDHSKREIFSIGRIKGKTPSSSIAANQLLGMYWNITNMRKCVHLVDIHSLPETYVSFQEATLFKARMDATTCNRCQQKGHTHARSARMTKWQRPQGATQQSTETEGWGWSRGVNMVRFCKPRQVQMLKRGRDGIWDDTEGGNQVKSDKIEGWHRGGGDAEGGR